MLTGEDLSRLEQSRLSLWFCCTQRYVGKCGVEGNPKISDLICPVNVCMKELTR